MSCALHIYYCCVGHITTAFSAGSWSLYHKRCVTHVQVTFLSLFSNVRQRHSYVFVFGVILGLFYDVFNCVCQKQIAVGWLRVRNEEECENRLPWSVLSRYPGIRFEPQLAINFRRASLRYEFEIWTILIRNYRHERYLQFSVALAVVIATRYAMDGLGIESRWAARFSHLSRLALSPPSLLHNDYLLSSWA